MKTKFENPPINELVIGFYFTPPLAKLRAEHIGVFWSTIQDSFPKSQNTVPIGGTDVMGLGLEEVFPLPRFWFISKDDSTLLQIQKNAFLCNWRKREGQYPHYENVKQQFDKYYQKFEKFVKEFVGVDEVYIDRCELSYINNIEESELFTGVKDIIKKIIPSVSFPETGLEGPHGINIKSSYKPAENTQITVTIQNRIGVDEEKKSHQILYYEIRASGKLTESTKSAADRFFEDAHETIGNCF